MKVVRLVQLDLKALEELKANEEILVQLEEQDQVGQMDLLVNVEKVGKSDNLVLLGPVVHKVLLDLLVQEVKLVRLAQSEGLDLLDQVVHKDREDCLDLRDRLVRLDLLELLVLKDQGEILVFLVVLDQVDLKVTRD